MYLNRVELIGFTGSDAETKTTPQGKTVTTFSIATKTSYIKAPREGAPSKGTERPRDGAQSRKSSTEWHRVQAWGRLGQIRRRLQEGLGYLRRRRVAQPRIREQRRQSPHV